ncbi:MAG: hypothetical protein Q9167_004939 [Letrouitia subvulpina]
MASDGSEISSRTHAPLSEFIKFLKRAQNITEIISLPATLLKATRDHFYARPQPNVSRSDLKTLVQAIDLPGSNLLKRESLHPVVASSDSTRALQKQKKKELGNKTIDRLLAGFLKNEESMGTLVAELLHDCRENKAHLRGIRTNLWQPLGEVIIHCSDETLKLIAGMIIREMLDDGVPASEFWHAGIDPAAYRGFPSDKSSTTQWVEDFTAFVDDLDSQKILTQKRSTIVFAHAVFVQGERFSADGSVSVLVAIADDLTIMIPRTENETARYIDVPLVNVKDALIVLEKHDSQSRSSLAKTSSVLRISFIDDTSPAYYINESERLSCDIELAFDAFEDAKMVAIHMGFEQSATRQILEPSQQILADRLPDHPAKLRISQSELIDVSEQLLDEDGHTVIEDGNFMASHADGHPTEQEDTEFISKNLHMVQHDDLKKRADEAAKDKATANVAKKRTHLFTVAQSPIDVSLVDDIEVEARASSQNDLDAIELNRSSLERWRKSTQSIGDSTRLKQPNLTGQDQVRYQQATGDDVDWSLRSDNDLYDASPVSKPKGYQAHTNRSLNSATQPRKEGGHIPRGKLSRSMRTMNGATQSAPIHDALKTSFKPYSRKAQPNPAKGIQKRRTKPKAFKGLTRHLANKASSDHEFWETGNRLTPDKHKYIPRVTERQADEFDIPSSSPSPQIPKLKAKRFMENTDYKKPDKETQPGKRTLQPKNTDGRITKSAAKRKSDQEISENVTKNKKRKENQGSKRSVKLLSENQGDVVIEEKPGVRLDATRLTEGQAAPVESQRTLLNVRNPVNVQPKPLRSTRAAAQIAKQKIQEIKDTESFAEEHLDSEQSPNAILRASKGQYGEGLQAAPPTARQSPSYIARKLEYISRDTNGFTNQTSNEHKTAEINSKRLIDQIMNDNETPGIQVPRSSPFLPPVGTSQPRSSTEKEIASRSNLDKATHSISHVSESNRTAYLATNPPKENLTLLHDDEGMYFQDAMASYDASAFAHPSPSTGSIASERSGLVNRMTAAKIEIAQDSTEPQKHVAPIAQTQSCEEGHDDSREPNQTLAALSPGSSGMQRLPPIDEMAGEQAKQFKTPLSTIAKDALFVLQPRQDQITLIPEDAQESRKPLKRPKKTKDFASCMREALSEVSNTESLIGRKSRHAQKPSQLKTVRSPRNNTKVKFMPVNESRSFNSVKRKTEVPDTDNSGQRVAPQHAKTNVAQEKVAGLYESALQLPDSDPGLDGLQSPIPNSNSYNTSHLPSLRKKFTIRRTPKQVQPQETESPTSSTYNKLATLFKDAVSKPQSRPGAELGYSKDLKTGATRKRQLDDMEMPKGKRSRQSSQETESSRGKEKPKPKDPTRIPQIISFGINGPKNQGTPSPTKVERIKNTLEQDHSENLTFKRPSAKRKREQTAIECEEDNVIGVHSIGAETKHRRKKERTDTDELRLPLFNITPYNEKRTQPRKARSKEGATTTKQKRFPEMLEEPLHRLSSQSLRVAENGSPLPFQHTRSTRDLKTVTLPENTHLEDSENIEPASDDEDLTLVPPAPVATRKLESRLPVTRRMERPFAPARISQVNFLRSTGGKRRPSSPNAPSSIVQDLHYHHVQLGGKLINIETAEPVVFAEPPDPFSEPTNQRPTNFMSMLRAASMSHKQNPVTSKLQGVRLSDPDRTLVEAPPLCATMRNKPVEINSDSEDSGSEDLSQSVEVDADLRSDEPNVWREALQPHHGDTLDILYEISHKLTQNLVDAETAVTDLVSDYKRRATRLVEQYERARKEEVEVLKEEMTSKVEIVRRNLIEWHAEVAKNLERNPMTDALAARVEAEQKGIIAQIEEAIAMCGE